MQWWDNVELKGTSLFRTLAELPSVENFICILQTCRKRKDVVYARHVHSHMCNNGLEAHEVIGNHIVPMFVECGSVSDAQQVFNRLVHRNEHSWTSLILGYVQSGKTQHALDLYQKMQEDGVRASRYTLMAVLKACVRLKDAERGRVIHAEIAYKGLERDRFVGSTLVDMYAKCDSLAEARKVFDKLLDRDVVSWAALIAGYAEYGPGEEALKCLEEMQLHGISPDAVTYVCGLKACGSIGAIGKGQAVHAEIAHRGLEKDLFVGNALIDMYAKCCSLLKARKVLHKMPVRDIVSWATIIAGYAECGIGQEALKCFEQLQLEGIFPNAVTFVCILKACGGIRAIDKGRDVHAEIAQKGYERDLYVGSSLVDMYSKCGSTLEAQEVFDKLLIRNVVVWDALIAGYAEYGPGQEALECFKQMQLEGFSPNNVTLACVLKSCGNIRATDKGREIHMEVVKKGHERENIMGNTLVDMYAKCGSLRDAWAVLANLTVTDLITWGALISGYTERGPLQEVLTCFEMMQLEGVSPDAILYVCALKACGSLGALGKGQHLHAEIAQRGFERDLFVSNTLVDVYATCGSLSEAQEVFDKLPVQDVVAWTALIAGYTEHELGQEALVCFEQMQVDGILPNVVTFVCGLKACSSTGAICKGREVHAKIMQRGFERDLFVGNTLIGMYSKCGSLSEAQEVFDDLPVQDVASWNALIKGYGMNHEVDMAIHCFDDMQGQGVKPDAITFTCLLNACSHTNLVSKGQEYFKMMKEEYGISPTIDHYTCMVGLLSRSGLLYEAEKFLDFMQCSPSGEIWTALLSACKTYGEAELGLKCFQQVVKMNPESAASYVLMANTYAGTGRWDDAYRIEELRIHAGAKKKPATALVEVKEKVYDFVVGDDPSKDITEVLEILSSRMQEEGHVPTLHLVL